MDNKAERPNEKVEGLLRRWGAREAEQQSEAGSPPIREPRPVRSWGALRRWGTLAAAVILVAVLLVQVLVPQLQYAREEASIPPARLERSVWMLELTEELEAARTALAQSEEQLAQQKQNFEEQIGQLKKTFEADKAELLAKVQEQTTALAAIAAEKQALESSVVAKAKEHETEIAYLAAELIAAREEIAGVRQSQEEAVLAQRKAQEDLKALQDQQTTMLAMMQRTYRASSAVNGQGYRVRQEAARQNRLINRGMKLRDTAPDQKSQRLFDTLEVVLTRLEMLDVEASSDRSSFARLLRETDLLAQINAILRDWDEPSAARTWLIETKVLLMGAEDAS